MLKVVFHVPEELAVMLERTGLPSKVTVTVSLGLKPDPLIITAVPVGPLVGLIVTAATDDPLVTLNVTLATVPVRGPDAPTVWLPDTAEFGTKKPVAQVPAALAETAEATEAPSKVTTMFVSFALKPEPLTVT